MPRVRKEPIHPFIQLLMDRHGCRTIQELSDKTGVPYMTIKHYADNRDYSRLSSIIRNAEALGLSVDEFLRGLCSA